MNTRIENLKAIRVAEVMNRDVVALSANSTMAEAADRLAQHDIHGAPVVDELGHCIGVLSTSDFARLDQMQEQRGVRSASTEEFILSRYENKGPFRIEHAATDTVSQHMSRAPQTIDAKRSLIDAARAMHGQRIHRLIVIDSHGRPVGVLSTLDILAALVAWSDSSTPTKT